MSAHVGPQAPGQLIQIEDDPRHGFDRGFLLIGIGLAFLFVFGVAFGVRDLVVVTVMTVLLWLSVGAVMVLSRILGGRWE